MRFAHLDAHVVPDELRGDLAGQRFKRDVAIGLDGDLVTFNTAEGRLKTKNVARDGRVAISVVNQENPYENLIIQGKVVELAHDGADDDIDALAKRYLDADSYPFRQDGEVRVIVKIEPEKVNHTNP